MVIDTSALVAILVQEKDALRYSEAIQSASTKVLSAASFVELTLVIVSNYGPGANAEIDLLLIESKIEVVPVTEHHARLARDGFVRYGKGRHPAGLNFGDCFAYALAKSRNEPLLFVGDDFGHTDVRPELDPS